MQTVVVAAVAGIGIIMTIVDHMAEMAVVTATTVSNRIHNTWHIVYIYDKNEFH